MHQTFKKFVIIYLAVFLLGTAGNVISAAFNGEGSSYLIENWKFIILIQSFLSMITSWVIIFWLSPECVNWRKQKLWHQYYEKVMGQKIKKQKKQKKQKKKKLTHIESLRSNYGGNK